MKRGKRLLLTVLLLSMFGTVAFAAAPQVESILQQHDIIVPFFLPRVLFNITPQGDDVSWSIQRQTEDGWEDATTNWNGGEPLQGEIAEDAGTERIWWQFKNYGDNTGHDGGVTHRLDVKVNDEVVTQVDFDVTYIPELGMDYISLKDWKTEEQLRAPNHLWYVEKKVCAFGPTFHDACDEITGEWYRFAVVDFDKPGTQVFDLICNDMWQVGYVTVTVKGDWAQVDYICGDDEQIWTDKEFFTFFGGPDDVKRLDTRRLESRFAYGQPFSISENFGDDRIVMLYVCNEMTFDSASGCVTRFQPERPENRQTVAEMTRMLLKEE